MNRINFFWLIAGSLITIVFFLPIIFLDYQEYTAHLIQSYPYLAPAIIVFFRFIGVVLAPLPGSPIAFASMALLPWQEAWIYNFLGSELGAVTAFLIARKFREPVVAHFAPLKKVHDWQEKISKKKQLWGFTGLRVVSIVAFDFVSYAAGLTKLPFHIFIIASLLVDIPVGFIFFYFGGLAVKYSMLIFGVFIIIFIIAALILSARAKKARP